MSIILWVISFCAVIYICYLLRKVLEPIFKDYTLIILVVIAIALLILISGMIDFNSYTDM